MPKAFSIVVSGLGGQGVLSVSKVIAAAAWDHYPFVCRTESRGLSQRGGAVCSMIRLGARTVAPAIAPAGADLVLSLDALEAARALPFLKPGGHLLTNEQVIPPAGLRERWQGAGTDIDEELAFKDQLAGILLEREHVYRLDLQALASQAKCAKGINSVLLGAASHLLPLPAKRLREAVIRLVKPQFREANATAFDLGRDALSANELSVPAKALEQAAL